MIERSRFVASVGELHAMAMPVEGEQAQLWIMQPTRAAVAMGSSQKSDQFDAGRLEADGVELAERRSGGGAVFIEPASTVWIDVLAPRTSPLWSTELTETFLITGRIWQHALASVGIETDLCVEAGQRTAASTLACWAGVGWGELTREGAKVVGLSQRRTRWGARVQAMAVLDGSSARVGDYLAHEHRSAVKGEIATHPLAATRDQLELAVLESFERFAID